MGVRYGSRPRNAGDRIPALQAVAHYPVHRSKPLTLSCACSEVDGDASGTVSFSEFVQMMHNLRQGALPSLGLGLGLGLGLESG